MNIAPLWPPLSLIQRSLAPTRPERARRSRSANEAPASVGAVGSTPEEQGGQQTESADVQVASADLLAPVQALARQRLAVAERYPAPAWRSGCLLQLSQDGQTLGVLLDQPVLGPGHEAGEWRAWVAASEADWASAYDVLLEPDDEPFEPLLGVVQTWNVMTLPRLPLNSVQLKGELSATRMAAMRAVAAQAVQAAQASPPLLGWQARPGQMALRSVAGLTVLTGTPLAAQGDPRTDYQALYKEAAARWQQALAIQAAQSEAGQPQAQAQARAPTSLWARCLHWLSPSGPWRPVAVALAVVVVAQQWLLAPAGESDDVRFRTAPATAPAAGAETGGAPSAVAADLMVQFQPVANSAEVAQLLRRAGAQVVAGPDAAGRWSLRLLHVREGQAVLQSSPLVRLTEEVP